MALNDIKSVLKQANTDKRAGVKGKKNPKADSKKPKSGFKFLKDKKGDDE